MNEDKISGWVKDYDVNLPKPFVRKIMKSIFRNRQSRLSYFKVYQQDLNSSNKETQVTSLDLKRSR